MEYSMCQADNSFGIKAVNKAPALAAIRTRTRKLVRKKKVA